MEMTPGSVSAPGLSAIEPTEQPTLQHTRKSKAFIAAFLSLCACNFASFLDTTIIATALPAITYDLNATSNGAYWCGTGFFIAQAVSQPVYGSLSNIFGRKACMLCALVLFIVASVFCAVAQDITWLIVARAFQGLGAGGNNAMVSVIVTDMVALHERAAYLGYISMSAAIATVSGGIIGAAISGHSNWRIIFWINLPICVPALAGVYFFIHLKLEASSIGSKLKRVDWIGILISTGSIIGVLYAIMGGGVLQPWSSPRILSPLLIGAVGVSAFILYEAKVATEPMIPIRIFTNRTSNGAYIASFVMGLVLWAMQYYLILYFYISRQHSLLGASVSMLPGSLTLPFSALIAALVVAKTYKFRTLNSVGWALITLGFGLIVTLSSTSNAGKQYGYQVIYGLGGGVVFLSRLCATQASQPDEDVAMATALVSFITSLGEAFGVGVGGAIYQNEWQRIVDSEVFHNRLPTQYILNSNAAEQAASLIQRFPPNIQAMYRDITAQVIDRLFIVLTALSGFAFLVSLTTKNLSLKRETHSAQAFTAKSSRDTGGTWEVSQSCHGPEA